MKVASAMTRRIWNFSAGPAVLPETVLEEARENLLDVFRDAADFWAEKKVPFRVFFSFQSIIE